MRIIKNFELSSNYSINSLAVSNDCHYIAFGDSNKSISVFPYKQLDLMIRRSSNSLEGESQKGKFQLYPDGGSLPKLMLNYHEDSVNALQFAKVNKYYLVSGGTDKNIIVWRIIEEGFTYEKIRIIKSQSDVTDLAILPNDEFIMAGCVDNNIYIWRSNFLLKTFDLVSCVNNLHSNFITSIVLDPTLEKLNIQEISKNIHSNGFKFASYSDDGKLVITETKPEQNGFKINVLKEYKEFVNQKNKINSIQKKIDWSSDGNWIVSVNHHYIKNHKVVHARLINLHDLNSSQVLVGHESAVLIAKFSPANYNDNSGIWFNLLATSDKNGNLIIWKISNSQFRVLTEISNFSEATITYLLWSYDGNYLFASNSNGSIYILEFNEFIKSSIYVSRATESVYLNPNPFSSVNDNLQMDGVSSKKRIAPQMINSVGQVVSANNYNVVPNLQFNNCSSSLPMTSKNLQNFNFAPVQNLNPTQNIQDCLRCQKQKIDELETKIVNIKLDSLEDFRVYMSWENKVYDNNCNIQLRINEKVLYHNKFENKLIRLFGCNNFIYTFYDANNLLSVYTVFNTMVFQNLYVEDITFIELYLNFLLFVTAENKITLIDVNKKEKILESYLDINSSTSSVITTKISSVKFLDLDKIIIQTDSFNVFKNTNIKNVLLYNKTFNILTQFENSTEIENIVLSCLQDQKKRKSQYNLILNDPKFYSLLEEKNLIRERDEKVIYENMKFNSEIRSIEGKLLFNQMMGQKDDFIFFLKKYLDTLVKHNLYYKLMDFFTFNFKFNEKKLFDFLQEKREVVLEDILKINILENYHIPEDVKEFIKKVFNM